MRATSAAEASCTRESSSTNPVAFSHPERSVLVSMGFHLLSVAMMAQPGGSKAFASFFLKDLIHQPVILSGIPGDAVEDEPTEAQGERPLPDFPQFIVVIALLLHDSNLVNGGIFQ